MSPLVPVAIYTHSPDTNQQQLWSTLPHSTSANSIGSDTGTIRFRGQSPLPYFACGGCVGLGMGIVRFTELLDEFAVPDWRQKQAALEVEQLPEIDDLEGWFG